MDDFESKPSLSSLKREFLLRQPIRPFISSTFTDFQIERDYLVRNVFPQLNAQCREHGTYFAPIDLRWGITKEQANTGNVIKLCLDYINQCAPFFICLLGERYGSHRSPEEPPLPKTYKELGKDASWLDKNYMIAAENGFSWILQDSFQNSSITELEIIQASFLNDSPHVRFYFREMVRLEDLFPDLSDDWKEEQLKSFKSESEYAELKVSDLKKRITNKGLDVQFFRTPEQLGELILNDWKQIIDECYPPITALLNEYGGELFEEWCAHEALAQTRTRVYVTNPMILELFDKLGSHAVDALEDHHNDLTDSPRTVVSVKSRDTEPVSLMMLVGDRGCGKTAFLANWVKHFQAHNPGMKVLSHYVGSSALSSDITSFMRRVTFELRENYSNDESEDLLGSNNMDFHSICEAFSAALLMGPCVMVIDGIDELGGSYSASAQQVKEMNWLPNPLPNHCKVIISTIKSDLTYKSLLSRPDVVIHQVPAFSDATDKASIMEKHLALYFKSLDAHQMEQVLNCPMSDRPLFLTILANELRVFGSFHKLDEMLSQYCACTSFRDLWRRIIEHWCKAYGWQRDGFKSSHSAGSMTGSNFSGWVVDLLCLIATSRHGLSESELLGCLRLLGYSGQTEVTRFDFARFRLATQSSLCEKPGGLITFFHNHLREAVQHCLLGLFGTGASDNQIGSSSALMQSVLHRQKRFYSEILAKYFWELPHSSRRTLELPWQLDKIGDMESLSSVLSQPEVFSSMYGDGCKYQVAMKIELMQYWNVLRNQDEPYNPAEIYTDMVHATMQNDKEENNIYPEDDVEIQLNGSESDNSDVDGLNSDENKSELDAIDKDNLVDTQAENIGETQGDSSLSDTESEGSQSRDKNDKKPRHEIEVAKLAMNAGNFLNECNKFEASYQLLAIAHEQLLKSYPLTVEEQFLLVRVKESLGNWNLYQLNTADAETFYQKALETVNEIQDEHGTKKRQIEECKGRLMTHLGRKKVFDGHMVEAEKLLKGAVGSMKNANSTIGLSTAYYNLGTLRAKQHKYQSAEKCFRDALKTREKWYGRSHPLVAEVLNELAGILCKEHYKNSDKLQAEASYRRALSIREKSLSKDHLLVATTLFHLGKLLRSIGTYQCKTEAAIVLKRSLDIRTTTLGSNHKITNAVRSSLKSLEKELQQGEYTDATSKQPDKRSRSQPFSNMSWHDQDLVEFERQLKEKEKQEVVQSNNVNGDFREYGRSSGWHGSEESFSQSPSRFEALNDTDICRYSVKTIEGRANSKSPDIISNYSESQKPKRPVIPKNTRKGKQLSAKFRERELDYGGYSRHGTPEFDLEECISCSTPNGQRTEHLFSDETKGRPYSSVSQISHVSHWSRCNISSKFSIDTSNAMTIQGPHSQVEALLGDPPCPRDITPEPKYKASWYHVPGRYSKHALDYPPKRYQSRPNKGNALNKI
ncbi:putative tetratricopeptide repeat protein 41 [Anneissia japonica]|uniref:putative tetratricopeptide repeat protein 41 n=1 Tax=Anneissia japonica TaxID=1529436 RepID=UPI001425ADDD|nr:putative tetratricopeptide repeat protein 41 [Anneissia japonica]